MFPYSKKVIYSPILDLCLGFVDIENTAYVSGDNVFMGWKMYFNTMWAANSDEAVNWAIEDAKENVQILINQMIADYCINRLAAPPGYYTEAEHHKRIREVMATPPPPEVKIKNFPPWLSPQQRESKFYTTPTACSLPRTKIIALL